MGRTFSFAHPVLPARPAASVFAAAAAIPVQTKLTLGAPGDRFEREADETAARVVSWVQRREMRGEPGEESEISPVSGPSLVQGCDACGGTCGDPAVETRLRRARREGGEPLAPSVRQPMEKAFRTGFGGVSVHRDRVAHQLNETFRSRAFTTGKDVFFRQGEYAPATPRGQELIAHELTHVLQQTGKASPGPGTDAVQRACTRAECGPDPDPSDDEGDVEMGGVESDEEGADVDMHLQNKPLAGHPFVSTSAVAAPRGGLMIQRAGTVTGALNNAAATPNNLGAGAGVFADNYGATGTNKTATWMTADWLHRQALGTGVNGKRPDHWAVFKGLAAGLNPFCQGHLLSKKLGGKGVHKNLSPFTRSLNGLHETNVESEVIDWTKMAGQDKWAHYKVTPNYAGNADVDNWALGKYNGMAPNKRKAAANAIPGKGPFATAPAADAVAQPWIQQYVQDTFPTDIDCDVKFIRFTGGNYKATAWQNVNITNEF